MATDPRVHNLRLADYGIPLRLRNIIPMVDPTWEYDTPAEAAFVEGLRDRLVTSKRKPEDFPADISKIGQGLAYVGPPGTGKTTRAVKMLLAVYYRWSVPVLFASFADYVEERKEAWSATGTRAYDLEVRQSMALTFPVVVLDDIGKESKNAKRYGAEVLDALLRARHREGRPSIITTNVPLSEWAETYNPSMGSFVQEAFVRIKLTGADLRGEG